MLKFYYSSFTCSTASHIALEESGLPYEAIEVSWKRNLNVEKLNQLNSLGAVPVLVTQKNEVITQNTAILEYIADQVPAKKLLASVGTAERSQTLSWVSFVASDLQKSYLPLFRAEAMTSSVGAQKEIEKFAEQSVRELLNHVDSALAKGGFIVGEHFTIADALLFVISGWAEWAEIDLAEYENLARYRKQIAERPAVEKILKLEDS